MPTHAIGFGSAFEFEGGNLGRPELSLADRLLGLVPARFDLDVTLGLGDPDAGWSGCLKAHSMTPVPSSTIEKMGSVGDVRIEFRTYMYRWYAPHKPVHQRLAQLYRLFGKVHGQARRTLHL